MVPKYNVPPGRKFSFWRLEEMSLVMKLKNFAKFRKILQNFAKLGVGGVNGQRGTTFCLDGRKMARRLADTFSSSRARTCEFSARVGRKFADFS